MEIIVTHISTDFDAFAATIAAKKIYPEADILLPTSVNQNVRKFITLHEDDLPPLKDPRDINLKKVKKIIMVDTHIGQRIGYAREALSNKGVKILVYDHHQESDEDVKTPYDYSLEIGATTSLLVNIINKKRIQITPLEATVFALGIYEDTGSFTYPNTSPMDLEAASWLLTSGANLFVLNKFHNISLTKEQHGLLEKLIDNAEKIKVKGKEILLSCTKTESYIEGLSVLTRKLSQIEDLNVVFCWVKMKDKVYIVARSYDQSLNVSKILEEVGGGGHPQAASAVEEGDMYETIKDRLIKAIKKNLKTPTLARDVMSYPVRFVKEDDSIKSVDKILKKYGHSGIPIISPDGKLAGIITRKDIDKAIKHGLSHAPVKGFRSREIITAKPGDTVEEIQRMMVENGIGRIPVMSNDNIVGIVTRKDILRYLHGFGYDRGGSQAFKKGIKEKIKNHFPERILNILRKIPETGKDLNYNTYLVGGIVRDILLGIPNLDIDIVVEGNGIEFAQHFKNKFDCRVESHKKFKTAVIILKGGLHIDVATARVEHYEKPAALPSVEVGSIKQDLSRRDFTINTMALSLNEKNFGQLLDFFGGRKDLKERRIKVLHKLSFIEDPTRIFRAARFEQRLGFKMDSQTERLAKTTIKMDIVSKLTGVRIRDEIIAILNEEAPWRPVKRLYELGALEKIGLKIKVDKGVVLKMEEIISAKKNLEKYYDEKIEKWRLLFIFLLKVKTEIEIKQWCFKMKVKEKDTRIILSSISKMGSAKKNLKKKIDKNSKLYKIVRNFTPELQIICSTWGEDYKENISRYLKKLSRIQLEIDGNTLIDLGFKPSIKFKYVLEKLLELKLDGKVKTREEEIKHAKKLF